MRRRVNLFMLQLCYNLYRCVKYTPLGETSFNL
nr:MAG TPA: hypothetical protein [Caudoviricetes sp.]